MMEKEKEEERGGEPQIRLCYLYLRVSAQFLVGLPPPPLYVAKLRIADRKKLEETAGKCAEYTKG